MIISLLTGSCLAVGFILVMLATDYADLASSDEDESWVDVPDQVSISEAAIKPDQDLLTISGQIRNDAPYDWKSIWVNANVYVGSAMMNRCFEVVKDIPKRSTTSFEVQCDWTTGTELPDQFRFTMHVADGVRDD
tara:strand:+ start:2517 stop:2921 length:405 start_codon:yes stop_codon:yes gene_type:complete